jgi:hypothetical protein
MGEAQLHPIMSDNMGEAKKSLDGWLVLKGDAIVFDEGDKVCGNCKFSRTTRIFDPVAASFDHMKQFSEGSVTKCHIQGAPRQVDPVVDWCFKWETSTLNN